jgi:hypothetical protein
MYGYQQKSFLISYDLSQPDRNYSDLYQAIKNCGSYWTHILESVWIVKSTSSADQIRDQLVAAADKNDSFLVIEVTSNYSGWLTEKIWEVLRKVTSN